MVENCYPDVPAMRRMDLSYDSPFEDFVERLQWGEYHTSETGRRVHESPTDTLIWALMYVNMPRVYFDVIIHLLQERAKKKVEQEIDERLSPKLDEVLAELTKVKEYVTELESECAGLREIREELLDTCDDLSARLELQRDLRISRKPVWKRLAGI